jgi:hypothetical protein
MGQYFKAVNFDKREYVCPWCLGGGAKLWEWAANPQGAVFTLLLRKSSAGGGGDYYGYRTQCIEIDRNDASEATETFIGALRSTQRLEGQPIEENADAIVGRWAGDHVALVGDYDASAIWDDLTRFKNVSRELVEAWNRFIELPDLMLRFNPDCSCAKGET